MFAQVNSCVHQTDTGQYVLMQSRWINLGVRYRSTNEGAARKTLGWTHPCL